MTALILAIALLATSVGLENVFVYLARGDRPDDDWCATLTHT